MPPTTNPPRAPVRTFHNLQDFSGVLNREITRVGSRTYPRNTYGTVDKIGHNDILYRASDVSGSYSFYVPLFLDCVAASADSNINYPYLATMARQKVANRAQIAQLRKELLEHLAIPY